MTGTEPPREERGWWIDGKFYPAEGGPARSAQTAPQQPPGSQPPPPQPAQAQPPAPQAAGPPPAAGSAPWAYPQNRPPAGRQPAIIVTIAAAIVILVVGAGIAIGVSHHSTAKQVPAQTAVTAPRLSGVPSGYTAFVDRADQFRIAVPATWRHVDPSSPGAKQTLQALTRANPKLAQLFQSTLESKAIKYFAIQINLAGPSPSVNVTVTPALGVRDQDLHAALTSIASEYRRLGITIRHTTFTPLAGHEALELTLATELTLPDGSKVPVTETQYVVAANDTLYTITLSGTSPQFQVIASTFRASTT